MYITIFIVKLVKLRYNELYVANKRWFKRNIFYGRSKMSEENKRKSEESLERICAKTSEGTTPASDDNSDEYSAIADNKEIASKFVEATDEENLFELDRNIRGMLRRGTCTKDDAMNFLSKSAHCLFVTDIAYGLAVNNPELIASIKKEQPDCFVVDHIFWEASLLEYGCKGKDNFCEKPKIEMKDYVLGAVTGRICRKSEMIILRKVAELDGYLEEFEKANSLPKVYDHRGRVVDEKALAEYRKVKASSRGSKTNTGVQMPDGSNEL